jgi:hypothetical protein
VNKVMLIVWPSFIAAGLAEVVFFTLFDPDDLDVGRLAAYTVGFFLFWLLAATSSTLTWFLLQRPEGAARAPEAPYTSAPSSRREG